MLRLDQIMSARLGALVARRCSVLCLLLGASLLAAEPARKLTIVPESFLRGYDPVTIFFASPTGPATPGPEDHPERYAMIEPPHPGEYRWLDASTLIFKPAVPWPALSRFRWKIGSWTKTLTTMMVAPSKIDPSDGASELDPITETTLTFRESIDPAKLAQMVTFEIRPLPGIDKEGRRWLTSEHYEIKPIERASMNDPAAYVFRFATPIEAGSAVVVHVRLSLDDSSADSLAEYRFSTRAPFRIVAAGCIAGSAPAPAGGGYGESESEDEYDDDYESGYGEYDEYEEEPEEPPADPGMLPLTLSGTRYTKEQAVNGGTGEPKIAIRFSADPEPLTLSAVKSLLRVSPSIRDLTFSQSGPYLYVTGRVERETIYKAVLAPAPIRDTAGRMLRIDGPSEIYFHFPRREPFLRWTDSQGIVERFGPQMFPMAGRGDTRADMRVYKVDPLDRNFWPFPATPVIVDETDRPPGPGEEPPSAETIRDYIDAESLATRLKSLGSPPVSRLVTLPVQRDGGATSFGLPLKEHLRAIAGGDQPGTYVVGVRRLADEGQRQYVRIQVTDLCLTTVEEERAVELLVTSLKTGKPVAGASVTVEGTRTDAAGAAFVPMIAGTTDARGLYRYEHREALNVEPRRIVVRNGQDVLVLQPSVPPYSFADNHWHGPRGLWLGWLNAAPRHEADAPLLMSYIFTERPVYRPEEEVHIKGYLRNRERGRLTPPPRGRYELLVQGPGEKQWTRPVEITAEGSFYHRFQEKELPTGGYSCALRDIDRNLSATGRADWKMEAYKIPKFEVQIHGPDRVPMDRELEMTATASYYAGGRVVGQPVLWRVTQFPYAHVPEKREGFIFSTDERFSRQARFMSSGTREKSDKTDDSGATKMSVNPALEIDSRPRQYIFEVTVTGPDEETVTATRPVYALPPFVLGLQTERFLKDTKTISPKIIAIDVNNNLLDGQDVAVRLLAREWHSHLRETDFSAGQAKYMTDMVDREISQTSVKTSAGGPVAVDMPVERAGIYIVELSSRDQLGRLQLVSVDLYVAGDEPVAWKKPEANVFETVADKKEYAPGETAQILLKSPFQQASVLAVIEAPDGNVYEEIAVTGGKAVFPLPIKNEYNPRIPVHFVLMRGRLATGGGLDAGGVDLGRPATVAATQWVNVNPVGYTMSVKLEHPERAMPGQDITVGIKLADPSGKPVGGEVTLWLVDQAVLALAKEKPLEPVKAFIRDVRSQVSIRDTRNSTIGEIGIEESEGGGGAAEEMDLLGKVTVRKEFKAVPYYNPRIIVDQSGAATVKVKLSDDLTVFKVRAVASSGLERFGTAKGSLAVRLPVIVQPALPRFVRTGDVFVAGGIGRVVEGEGGPGSCQLQVDGATLTGDVTKRFQWIKDSPERLYFPMTVGVPAFDPENPRSDMTLRMAVRRDTDGAADAFEVKIPVLPDREPVRVERFGRLELGKAMLFPKIDTKIRPGTARQELLVTDQEAVLKLVSGLDYLLSYQHLCAEQRLSQSYPAVALKSLYSTFRIKVQDQKIDEIVHGTFDYLGKCLKPNGLYSFWPGGRGSVSLTAYAVEFLGEAKKAGYAFNQKLLDRPVAALKDALRSDYSGFVDGASFIERSEALCALSSAGQFDVSYGSELARKVGYLDLYSEAKVLLAYNLGQKGGGRDNVEKLRKDLWANTVIKLQDGREVYGGLQSRMKSWGGLVLSSELKTEAAMIRALYKEDAANPKMKLMLDDFLKAGEHDGWGNTNTNAAALLALRDVVATPRAKTSAELTVTVGDSPVTLKIDEEHPAARFASPRTGQGSVTLAGGGGPDAPYFARATVSYVPEAAGDTAAASNEGFVVRRELQRVKSGDEPPVREWIEKPAQTFAFAIGDIVEHHAQVICPEDRHYVAVVVPLAAGMEPLNPNLATSPPESKPAGADTLQATYAMFLDEEVRYYFETLPKGTYDFHFRVRAMTEGSYVQPPARAEMMYQPRVKGSSAGARIVVKSE